MPDSVRIRVWQGATVVGLFAVSPTGNASMGAVGGAENSTRPHIEIDPWNGLLVDNRPEFSTPLAWRDPADRYERGSAGSDHCGHGAHPHGGNTCLDCPMCRPDRGSDA